MERLKKTAGTSDLLFRFALWMCPGCQTALSNQKPMTFTDQLMLFLEKLTSKHFPLRPVFDINSRTEVFVGIHELFILFAEFGGAYHVCQTSPQNNKHFRLLDQIVYSGESLIEAHRAYQLILRKVMKNITLPAFKKWLVKYFVPIEFFAMPVLLNLSGASRTTLMKVLMQTVHNRSKTQSTESIDRRRNVVPKSNRRSHILRLNLYFRLTFSQHINVCFVVGDHFVDGFLFSVYSILCSTKLMFCAGFALRLSDRSTFKE